jgi:hypothetical protein
VSCPCDLFRSCSGYIFSQYLPLTMIEGV